eukprot:10726423-Alexandrium_andersonii.AAC.1
MRKPGSGPEERRDSASCGLRKEKEERRQESWWQNAEKHNGKRNAGEWRCTEPAWQFGGRGGNRGREGG